MAPTSNEDVASLQDDVQKLRDKLAVEEGKRAEREQALANDVTAANLRAEKARLEAALADAKATNTAAAVKAGVAAPIEAAKEDQKRAEAQRDAVVKAADSTDEK